MEINKVTLKWENGAEKKIKDTVPDKIVRDIATITLNTSFPMIPERTGKMRQSTLAKGVQGSNCHYKIGSYTDYASYVYNMPDKTHWTTPGTNGEWFIRTWKMKGKSITSQAVGRNKLK